MIHFEGLLKMKSHLFILMLYQTSYDFLSSEEHKRRFSRTRGFYMHSESE